MQHRAKTTHISEKTPVYTRLPDLTQDEREQFTLAHEMVHILADANPIAVDNYTYFFKRGREEDMENEIALHAISGGNYGKHGLNLIGYHSISCGCPKERNKK